MLSKPKQLFGVDESESGLTYEAFTVQGKPPAYLGIESGPEEATIGLRFTDRRNGRSIAFVPGIRHIDSRTLELFRASDCILFDGTCWSDDEMIVQGIGNKTARSMGHIAISGTAGSLTKMAALSNRRRIYIHINNTNPILDEESAERRKIEQAGWEVAYDSMDFEV